MLGREIEVAGMLGPELLVAGMQGPELEVAAMLGLGNLVNPTRKRGWTLERRFQTGISISICSWLTTRRNRHRNLDGL